MSTRKPKAGKTRRPSRKAKKPSSLELAKKLADAALDMKAHDILILDVSAVVDYTDFLVIASGRSTRQAQSIADNIQRALKNAGTRIIGVEGEREGNWVLIDGGAVIVHVFYSPVREFYELEKMWGDAKIQSWPESE